VTTIGVAIPVPDPYGSLLREKRAAFGDPLAETVPSHVTLIPPTEIQDDQLDVVADSLERASVTLPPFPMSLRGTGTFRPVSPVVFVAVSQGISYTEMLAQCVRTALASPEPEFPFHPHVTVAHNLDDTSLDRAYDELRDFECRFTVSEFALYHHEPGSGWVPQRAFTLGP
jgi:2'-5' RNA ligase